MKFKCKYCDKEMTSSFLEYMSNSFCNSCLNERIENFSEDNGKISLFGVDIDIK